MWSTEGKNTVRCNISQGHIWIVPQLMLKLTYIGKIFTCGIINKLLDRISFEVQILKKKKKKSSTFFKEDSIHRKKNYFDNFEWCITRGLMKSGTSSENFIKQFVCDLLSIHVYVDAFRTKVYVLLKLILNIQGQKLYLARLCPDIFNFFSIKMEFD